MLRRKIELRLVIRFELPRIVRIVLNIDANRVGTDADVVVVWWRWSVGQDGQGRTAST